MSLVDLATWKVTRAFLVLWSGYSCCPLLAPNCDHWVKNELLGDCMARNLSLTLVELLAGFALFTLLVKLLAVGLCLFRFCVVLLHLVDNIGAGYDIACSHTFDSKDCKAWSLQHSLEDL
ncbi:uncharacterized protein [Physcomitrium patens]|uniref:uncharacterized protein isoform X2 n=1 Tax=Physcomitrium patens TaxID=3218 RepID=UPI003CCDF533